MHRLHHAYIFFFSFLCTLIFFLVIRAILVIHAIVINKIRLDLLVKLLILSLTVSNLDIQI
jgi:hypothetical protein